MKSFNTGDLIHIPQDTYLFDSQGSFSMFRKTDKPLVGLCLRHDKQSKEVQVLALGSPYFVYDDKVYPMEETYVS
jgi:hypothetical protein